jgi:hypothetical protein
MNQNPPAVFVSPIHFSKRVPRRNGFLPRTVTILLLTLCLARADENLDYLSIYNEFGRADQLAAKGETAQAQDGYRKAQRELEAFQQTHPNWNREIVNFRLQYLAAKIAATSEKTAPTETASSTANTAATAPAGSPVKLIAPGSEPRTVLRLRPAAGARQTMSMTLKMAMDITAAGQHFPSMNIPALTMTMTVEVKDVAANGDIDYGMTYTDATLAADTNTPPAVATAMKSALDSIHGMTATGKMTSQGVVKAMHIKLPAGAAPQLSQTMSQMKEAFANAYVPFPAEAVGPGAKWEYTTKIRNQGMTIEQTATYELASNDNNLVKLNTSLTQRAAHQQVQNPAMPGMKMELAKLSGNGTGQSTFDLTHITPQSATLNETTDMAMSVNMGQQKQEMTMKMDMAVSVETM